MSDAAGRRILVVDDDAFMRRFVGSLLTNHGYEVHEAVDGENGLRLAASLRPHLILVDLVMPYKDGYELIQALKSDPETHAIPVVVVSVRDREEDVVKGLKAGAEDYMIKPFSTQELLVRIGKILDRTG
jgi:DNA-binding response OmpR family regulator